MSQQQVVITQDEFREWTENKITKSVVKQIVDAREGLSNYIATGNTIGSDAEYSTDFMVGQIRGITELFNLFSEVKEEVKDYEH
jgi:hypothetical protein